MSSNSAQLSSNNAQLSGNSAKLSGNSAKLSSNSALLSSNSGAVECRVAKVVTALTTFSTCNIYLSARMCGIHSCVIIPTAVRYAVIPWSQAVTCADDCDSTCPTH